MPDPIADCAITLPTAYCSKIAYGSFKFAKPIGDVSSLYAADLYELRATDK